MSDLGPSWDVPVRMLSDERRADWLRITVHGGQIVLTPPAGPFSLGTDQVGAVRDALREARGYLARRQP